MNVKLLKFGAEWCGPCGVMDKRLENFDKCELIKYSVDDDENEELVDKYNIRNIPVLIIVNADTDEELHRWTGLVYMDELNKKIDEFIS